LLPTIGAFPVTWQTRAIARSFENAWLCRSKADYCDVKPRKDQVVSGLV
jgi:hypothetical protein